MDCESDVILITAPGQRVKCPAVWFLDGGTRILNSQWTGKFVPTHGSDLEPAGGAETSGAISPHPLTRTGSKGTLLFIGEPLISMILGLIS